MACGRPVIVADSCGAASLVGSGDNGWVVRSGDCDALTAALEEAYRRRADLPEMGRRARRDVEAFAGRSAAARVPALLVSRGSERLRREAAASGRGSGLKRSIRSALPPTAPETAISMRILITSAFREVVGGIETYLRELLPLLAGRGHELAALYERAAPPGRETIDERMAGLPSWCVETAGPAAALRDATLWRPDVAYVHGLESPAVEEAVLEAFPAVLFAHNYHGACVSGTKRHALPSARPCGRRFGSACLLHYYTRRCGGLNRPPSGSCIGSNGGGRRCWAATGRWRRPAGMGRGVPPPRRAGRPAAPAAALPARRRDRPGAAGLPRRLAARPRPHGRTVDGP